MPRCECTSRDTPTDDDAGAVANTVDDGDKDEQSPMAGVRGHGVAATRGGENSNAITCTWMKEI